MRLGPVIVNRTAGKKGWDVSRTLRATLAGAVVAGLTAALVPAGAQAAVPWCAGVRATIVGTNRDDVLKGTSGRDVIVARSGDDTVAAGAGNDLVCAGPGDDVVRAGEGADHVLGSTGADDIDSGEGDDRLDGGPGTDLLRARSDIGGTINLPSGTASGTGEDRMGRFEQVACAGTGAYVVYTDVDTALVSVTGQHDDFVMTADSGLDAAVPLTLSLGLGDDHYVVRQAGVSVVEAEPGTSDGYDLVDVTSPGTTTVDDGSGGLRVDTIGPGREVVTVAAEMDPIYLDTGAGSDVLAVVSGGGPVSVAAGDGADTLRATVGQFTEITLGAGADRLIATRAAPTQQISGGPGTDEIRGGAGPDLVDLAGHRWRWDGHTTAITDFERVVGGEGADDLYGAAGPDVLRGGDGADLLVGSAGDDDLDGGAGSDVARGGAGDDRCRAEQREACESR